MSTNKMPGEISLENISLHVIITYYLRTLKGHCCYGYMINCTLAAVKVGK